MRLPYVDNPPQFTSPDDQAILSRVQERRGQNGLIPLDLALLHAPTVADGWNSHLGAIRTKTSLPANIREIAILRPALLNGAWFEWTHHLPILQSHPTYTPCKLPTISSLHPRTRGSLTAHEWLALRYADAVTRSVAVPKELFDELRAPVDDDDTTATSDRGASGKPAFTDAEIVELTATVATYNMVSRFLVALDVGEANGKVPDGIEVEGGGESEGGNK